MTDDAVLARADVVGMASNILGEFAGAVAVHVRGPRTDSRKIYELVDRIAESSIRSGQGVSQGLFVNDRVDVALACGTGVHLGSRSLPVSATRSLVPPHTPVGRSIRKDAVEGIGANFLFAGPVFDTPSHPDLEGRGATWITTVTQQAEVPVMAIGGISVDRIGVLLDAGAHGIAVIRAVWDAPDPLRAVEDLQKCLENCQTS